MLGRAEAFLSERQIDRHRQDDDVFVEPGGFAVEADVLQRADGCVHGRKYAYDHCFVLELRRGHRLQIPVQYLETGRAVSRQQMRAYKRYRLSPESDFPIVHNEDLKGFMHRTTCNFSTGMPLPFFFPEAMRYLRRRKEGFDAWERK